MKMDSWIVANDNYVFREEGDDWALLFNPDSSDTFGMNQVGAFIYRHIDGESSIEAIVDKLRSECPNAPSDIESVVVSFVENLIQRGLAKLRCKED